MTIIGCLLRDQLIHVTITEKRREITRTRRVKLSGRILRLNTINDDIYIFSEKQIVERQAAIESVKLELFNKTVGWLELSMPLQNIQEELKQYYISSGGHLLVGDQYDFGKSFVLFHQSIIFIAQERDKHIEHV